MKQEINNKLKYMIYNHGYIFIKEFECFDDCKHWAINHLDQRNEIIIRMVYGLNVNNKIII